MNITNRIAALESAMRARVAQHQAAVRVNPLDLYRRPGAAEAIDALREAAMIEDADGDAQEVRRLRDAAESTIGRLLA